MEWFVPRCIIKAIARGAHVIYLLCTGSFCAAFWIALGYGTLGDDRAPSEVLRISLHFDLDSILLHFNSLAASCMRQFCSLLCCSCICCDCLRQVLKESAQPASTVPGLGGVHFV